eukprot:GFKZ01005288.1.p1 GENE.GFKZ01005288.1~~GFKZ01005288.1.p1  ORF type:complete len:366 (+),score=36.65 GFKZ01005288.1:107-1099(+)
MCLSPSSTPPTSRPAKIVCIGDIHGEWTEADESALLSLNPDLALFVGDYGDEDVEVTRRISNFAAAAHFGVATVFGNHDAFFTASENARRRAPYDKRHECRVTEQMRLLKPHDVSYRSVAFESVGLSVCGGRAFSVGGPNWKHKEFYRHFVGIQDELDSTRKMEHAVQASLFPTVVFLSHNGPTGLGSDPSAPCGKDWGDFPGGDYGDADLRAAIEKARLEGMRVPLTVFGHMHKQLMKNRGERTMVMTEPDGESGGVTVMVNAAVVPRHKVGHSSMQTLHHFQVVSLGEAGAVENVTETWVTARGQVAESYTVFDARPLSMSLPWSPKG